MRLRGAFACAMTFAASLSLRDVRAESRAPIYVFDLAAATGLRGRPPTVADPGVREPVWELAHAVASLQGVVNRDEARLYVRYVWSPESAFQGNVDDYWLNHLRKPGQWLHDRPLKPIRDLDELIRTFRRDLQGAVVYDPAVAATSSVASTIAGADDLIAVRYNPAEGSVYDRLIRRGPRLPVRMRLVLDDGSPMFTGQGTIPDIDRPSSGSAKCDAYLWAKARYLDTDKCDARFMALNPSAWWIGAKHNEYITNHQLTNHDYFISKRAFFCDLHVWPDEAPQDDPGQKPGTDLETFKAILRTAYDRGGKDDMIHVGGFTPWTHKYTSHTGGKHDPVPTEWETVRLVSAYNGFLDADAPNVGTMANASFYTHYPLRKRYPQRPWPTTDDLRKRGFVDGDGHVVTDDRQYVMVYVGDWDASAWAYQRLVVDMWNHPARGRVPMSWAISPVLERRVPMILAHLWETASPNDCFISADNGAGYAQPGMMQAPRPISGLLDGLDAWARHCTPIYRRWDLSITGFIIDGFAPGPNRKALEAYRRFSPNGIVPQRVPQALLFDGMPVLQADHDLLGCNAADCARHVGERIAVRRFPFHWFRCVLRAPDFYVAFYEELRAVDPRVKVLDAATFFELLRRYLISTFAIVMAYAA